MTLLCVLFISCDKTGSGDDPSQEGDGPGNIPEEYGDFELADNAVFITEDMTSMFSSVEDGRIVLSASAPAESVPEVGTVIISPITEKTPAGLLVKVVSVDETASGYTLTTEPVSLAEAFDELHVESAIDLSPFLEGMTDGDGNPVSVETVSSSIWDDFEKTPEDDSSEVPSRASGNADLAIKIPVSADGFSGHVFMDFRMEVDIDISRGRLNRFDIILDKQTGIAGALTLAVESGFGLTLVDKEYMFRPFLIPGTPVVVRPSIYIEDTFDAKGEIEMKSSLRFLCENQKYIMKYNGGSPSYDSERNSEDGSYMHSVVDLYEKGISVGSMSKIFSATCGGKFAFYDADILAFGVEASARQNFHLQNEIQMDNDGLLVQNPAVEITPSLEASVYCESFLFGMAGIGEDDRLQYTWDFGLPSYVINTLPKFMEIEQNNAGGRLNVSADVEDMCLLECSEKGFALFEEGSDEPIVHLSFGSGNSEAKTRSVISDEVSFTLPDTKKGYTARAYAVADGKYYYGEDESIWVDLGLPSGILWAKYNVGATSPEEYGGYYAWGETEEKDIYTFDTYKYLQFYGYDPMSGDPVYEYAYLGNNISGTEYDAANMLWNDGARLPTKNEIQELINHCVCKGANYNGVNGNILIGPNGNEIFIPLAGHKTDNELDNSNPQHGVYWTESYDTENNIYTLDMEYGHIFMLLDNWSHKFGITIRPVKDKEEDNNENNNILFFIDITTSDKC